jgi:Family of unknown function (DUF6086)
LSYVFDDETGSSVWVAGFTLGRVFVAMADCLASSAGMATGLEKMAEDWYRISPATFSAFVDNVTKRLWHNSTHRELERGFIAISMVLLERLGMTAEAEAHAAHLDLESPLSLEALREGMPPSPDH